MIRGMSNAIWIMVFAITGAFGVYGIIHKDLMEVAIRTGKFSVFIILLFSAVIFLFHKIKRRGN